MKIAVQFSESMTVNDAIQAVPRAAAVFHRFDIDACCGGSLPIGEAARINGSDLTALMRALERLACANSLDSMENSEMIETPNSPAELDVRVIPPREKHPAIFRTFEALDVGKSFVLVNDHDPLPLRNQLEAERTGQYGWEYLEEGPVVWRVEISRRAAATE